ncbi:MAG: hypothetical protein PHH82_02750 [Candidatus ainarchaeum sp.]|nr:hypothetical protein [Candidatus ainarchaeum sp.]
MNKIIKGIHQSTIEIVASAGTGLIISAIYYEIFESSVFWGIFFLICVYILCIISYIGFFQDMSKQVKYTIGWVIGGVIIIKYCPEIVSWDMLPYFIIPVSTLGYKIYKHYKKT